ncbi:TPA: S-type pyocin domain-containing protein [Enterobacter cloacae]|uniref:S-type pyocin domain-containing protein n=1 Tax=Enterobacter cloacae TaxID=550 RepID=UPI0021D19859|nr:S-type pyocin domain-containing protein [Enterobacter cloacae]MCU6282955.1 S-type pyocin domain-containing protein [Enterobacter cloacae]HEC5280743.1 S-type pyocin domain-containing protein [Enterobacter cloacae]HEC5283202.1 S-type pyocin domain-containing protein [Enterobacter cloacae]
MGYRSTNYGRGQALHGDRTTTGAICCSTLPNCTEHGRGVIRVGDKTTACPKCDKQGVVADGEPRVNWMGQTSAVDGSVVICGCPHGTNRVIAPSGEWLGSGPSPEQIAQEKHQAMLAARRKEQEAEVQRQAEERDRNRVFAKSCLRGEGCNDAGTGSEPHTNFAEMAFYQAIPNNALQHAQAAKRKALPKPKQRSALYLWWNGHHEEMDYQAAVAAEERAWTARNTIADASELVLVGGRTITSGTWAVRGAALGEIATGGLGAPVAGLLIGMYPGKLNDGEQDFIDRMRAEQMREAPTRVRFTWENDASGNPTPRGWHTPPGKDSVRVRRMEWDSRRQAYTFTTEEDPCITLIWTPDRTGESKPWDTGNHNPVRIPNPVVVDPLPEDTGIGATTSPTPEEKTFADYILILPVGGVPPIYVYLSGRPPVKLLEVDLYSNFRYRPRSGMYEADHMPSRAAVEAYLLRQNPNLKRDQLRELSDNVAAVIVPKEVHQRISETYGGRNSKRRVETDALNLRSAVDSNIDAMKDALKEQGVLDEQIETARERIHHLNAMSGLYK